MEQDEREAAVSEMKEEEMKQEKEKMKETVGPVVMATQQIVGEVDRVAADGVMLAGKRGKESDGDGASDEKEDVEGETWQMVQAKRHKLAEKKRKAKERKAKEKSDSVRGEEKKEQQVTTAVQSGAGAREWMVDGVGDETVLPDDLERHRAWVVSQLSLPSSMVDNIVNEQRSYVHSSLMPVYDMVHKLTVTLMRQCASVISTRSDPFRNTRYRLEWCRAVSRLMLSSAPLTLRTFSAAVLAVRLPLGCVALALPAQFPVFTHSASCDSASQ